MAKKTITNAQIERETMSTREKLATEETVLMILPEENGSGYVRVTINGYTKNIQCGVPVSVPKSIYLVLKNRARLLKENERLERKLAGAGANADMGVDM